MASCEKPPALPGDGYLLSMCFAGEIEGELYKEGYV